MFNYKKDHCNHPETKEHWESHPNQRKVTEDERVEIEKLFRLNVPFRNIRSEAKDTTNKHLSDYDLRNIASKQKKRDRPKVSPEKDIETEALKKLLETLRDQDTKNTIKTKVSDDGKLECLFLQLEFQLEWLQLYGQLIHIDGTFKVNCENYLLYVIMVQNSNGEGRPVAYCWMNAETKVNLEFCYQALKSCKDLPDIKVIMVDKDLTNINVLKQFFPNAKILYCLFHVIKWLKGVISKLNFQEVDMKNKVMVELKAMVWAASEEIYNTHYNNFTILCEESALMLDTEKPLLDYFNDNWHNCKEDWVVFYRRSIPTFGTNTNNHLESFNRNLKISVNHHLHLTASIKEIIKVF